MRTGRFNGMHGLVCTLYMCMQIVAGCRGESGREATRVRERAALRDTVVCMAYNVENLFDAVLDGQEHKEYRPGLSNWSREMYSRKLRNISSVIAAVSPDIAVLCEIENAHALADLRRALKQKRCFYGHAALGDRPNPSVTLPAVLSRYPIVSVRYHGVAPLKGIHTRNILETDIELGLCTLKVFAVHWPSKRNPESHRRAAARVLAGRLKELVPGTDYILAGDFNSSYNECVSFAGTQLDDTHGETGINHILRTVTSLPGDSAIFISEAAIARDPGAGYHYNLWFELPRFRRMSYKYRDTPETPDDILVPASLYDSAGISYIDNSFRVFRWNGRLLLRDRPFRWQTAWGRNGRRHIGDGYSDHLPLLVALRAGPFEARGELAQPGINTALQNSSSR